LGFFKYCTGTLSINVGVDCYFDKSDTILSLKSNIMLISFILILTCLVELRERLHLKLPGGPAKLQRINGEIQYTH